MKKTWHEATISFFDVTGKKLHTLQPSPNTVIEISFLPTGIYYLEIKTDEWRFPGKAGEKLRAGFCANVKNNSH